MDTEADIDYHAVARNAATVLAAAHRRLRAGLWTPTRAEQVMAANILAAARPDLAPPRSSAPQDRCTSRGGRR